MSMFENIQTLKSGIESIEKLNNEVSRKMQIRKDENKDALSCDYVEILEAELCTLRRQVSDLLKYQTEELHICQQAAAYASAKSIANAVLHALFDQCSAGKVQVIKKWADTGVIPTRDGLKHWILNPHMIRNEEGSSLLHVAVNVSMARQSARVKTVDFLLDELKFNVNITDLFGRTPLHIASMAGYLDVVKCLLCHNANTLIVDKAGMTPLEYIRTKSKPPEDIVQILLDYMQNQRGAEPVNSKKVDRQEALVRVNRLQHLEEFVIPSQRNLFNQQTDMLRFRIESSPLGFETEFENWINEICPKINLKEISSVQTLFSQDTFLHSRFIENIEIEASRLQLGYKNLTRYCKSHTSTWCNFIFSLQKAMMEKKREYARSSDLAKTESNRLQDISSSHTSRQSWYYAMLYKASTYSIPGVLSVQNGSCSVLCSENISHYFPMEDRLEIDSMEYIVKNYDSSDRTLTLDRPYEGKTQNNIIGYISGTTRTTHPPYISVKRIWESEPGNKFDDNNSNEQELFQDYQFLPPDSEYEIAVKLGPMKTSKEAKNISKEWKETCIQNFKEKKCGSSGQCCAISCPQREGKMMCVDTMIGIGKAIAKVRLGRPTYTKSLKARASMQKLQQKYRGSLPWPGSPSPIKPRRRKTNSVSNLAEDVIRKKVVRSLNFTDE